MSSLTLQNCIDNVRNLLGDNVNFVAISPDSRSGNSWTDAQVTDGVNFAVKFYCKKKPQTSYTETTAAAPTASGKLTAPTDYLEIVRVSYGGQSLVKSTQAFEAMMNQAWETTTASAPKRWHWVDGASVMLTPIPAAPTTTGVIGYTQDPADLVVGIPGGTVDARIPIAHQEYLKYPCAAYLLQMENDKQSLDLADKFLSEFYNLIGVA